ncbi:hypothetical protein GCM10010095_20520 [Streptomyces anthocyanicus]|nr:hypothetical protein GCM10010095_20520 [Streptomyces anthocyanicus]
MSGAVGGAQHLARGVAGGVVTAGARRHGTSQPTTVVVTRRTMATAVMAPDIVASARCSNQPASRAAVM